MEQKPSPACGGGLGGGRPGAIRTALQAAPPLPIPPPLRRRGGVSGAERAARGMALREAREIFPAAPFPTRTARA